MDINIRLDAGSITGGVDGALSSLRKIKALVESTEPITARLRGKVGLDVSQEVRALRTLMAQADATSQKLKSMMVVGSPQGLQAMRQSLVSQLRELQAAATAISKTQVGRGQFAPVLKQAFAQIKQEALTLTTAIEAIGANLPQRMSVTAGAVNQLSNSIAKQAKEAVVAQGQLQRALQTTTVQAQAARGAVQVKHLPGGSAVMGAANTIAAQTAAAMTAAVATQTTGAYGRTAAAANTVAKASTTLAEKSSKVTKSLQEQIFSANNLHSAYRGLASGFGAMWLTWGNVLPLLAGAGISNSIVQAIKAGAAMDHTLKSIEGMGEMAASEVDRVNKALLEMGKNSVYGPLEAAEAMKTLVYTGLSATDALAALPTVMDFSKIGGQSLKDAAETLVAIGTAFGYQAQEFSYVADIVGKAAADSMADVADMAQGFRQASIVAQQYGVSLKDVATGLALMSQIGIRGPMAGVSTRQMFNELLGLSEKSKKKLRELGIEITDNVNGRMRSLRDIVGQVSEKLRGMTFKEAMDTLQTIGNERGLKALSTLLQSFATDADKAGESMASAFDRMRQSLDDSAGFAARAASTMSDSVESQMKRAGAALQTTMVQAFQQAQPAVEEFFHTLHQAFGEESLQQSIRRLIEAAMALASAVINVTSVVMRFVPAALEAAQAAALLGGGFMAVRTAAMALTTAKAVMAAGSVSAARALTGATAAATATAAAATSAGTAATGAGTASAAASAGILTLKGAMFGLLGALVAVTAAYAYYRALTNTPVKQALKEGDVQIDKLRRENAELAKKIELMKSGASAVEAADKVTLDDALNKVLKPQQDDFDKHQATWHKERDRYLKNIANLERRLPNARGIEREELKRKINDERGQLSDAEATYTREMTERTLNINRTASEWREEQARREALNKEYHGLVEAEHEARFKATAQGRGYRFDENGNLVVDEPKLAGGGGKGGRSKANPANDELNKLQSLDDNLARLRDEYDLLASFPDAIDKMTDSEKKLYAAKSVLASATDATGRAYTDQEKATQALIVAKLEESAQFEKAIQILKDYNAEQAKIARNSEEWRESMKSSNEALQDQLDNFGKSTIQTERLKLARMETAAATGEAIKLDGKLVKLSAEDLELQRQRIKLLQLQDRQAWNKNYEKRLSDTRLQAEYEEDVARFTNMSAMERAKAVAARRAELDFTKKLHELEQQRGDLEGDDYLDRLEKLHSEHILNTIIEVNKAAREEFERTASQISQSLTDALLRGFESGKSFARNLLDTIKNMFKTLVLQPVLQTALMPVASFATSLTGTIQNSLRTLLPGQSSSGVNMPPGISTLGHLATNWLGMSAGAAPFTLGVANAVGAAGGNALSTFIAANGGWGTMGGASAASAMGATGAAGGGASGFLSAIPGWGWALGGALALFGNKMFGRKHTQHNLQGTFGGESGFEGYWHDYYKGGWFRSSKSKNTPLDEQFLGFLRKAWKDQEKTVKDYAEVLGLSTDKIAGFTYDINIKLKDIKADTPEAYQTEVMKRVNEAIRQGSVEMAQQIIGSWEEVVDSVEKSTGKRTYVPSEFARHGEDALQTLERLATSLSTVNHEFERLGWTMLEASLASGDLASAVADAFGGLDNFSSASQAFFQNYYSEEERRANLLAQVSRQMDQLGLAMPTDRAGFRSLVEEVQGRVAGGDREAIDLFARLMRLSAVFAEATESAEEAAKAAAEAAKEAYEKAKSLTDAIWSDLQNLFKAEIDALRKRADDARSIYEMSGNAKRDLWGQQADVVAWNAVRSNEFINQAVRAAVTTGTLPVPDELRKAIDGATGGLNMDNFTTVADFQVAQAILAAKLGALEEVAGTQLTEAERQIKLLEDQLDYWKKQIDLLRSTDSSVTSIADGIAKLVEAMEAERKAKEAAEQATKKPNIAADKQNSGVAFGGGGSSAASAGARTGSGNYGSREAAEAALRGMGQGAMAQAYYNGAMGAWQVRELESGTAAHSSAQAIRDRLTSWDGSREQFSSMVQGQSVLTVAAAMGYMADDVANFLREHNYDIVNGRVVPKFASGGYHTGGWRIVGERGPELEYTGPSRILNHEQSQALMRAASGDTGGSTAALERRIDMLERTMNRAASASEDTAHLLRRVTGNGNGMRSEIINPVEVI